MRRGSRRQGSMVSPFLYSDVESPIPTPRVGCPLLSRTWKLCLWSPVDLKSNDRWSQWRDPGDTLLLTLSSRCHVDRSVIAILSAYIARPGSVHYQREPSSYKSWGREAQRGNIRKRKLIGGGLCAVVRESNVCPGRNATCGCVWMINLYLRQIYCGMPGVVKTFSTVST
jgi:hypothetical protein